MNTGRETALQLQQLLGSQDLLRHGSAGTINYFVTDSPETFSEVGGRFLGEPVSAVKLVKNLDLKDFLLSA